MWSCCQSSLFVNIVENLIQNSPNTYFNSCTPIKKGEINNPFTLYESNRIYTTHICVIIRAKQITKTQFTKSN